MGTLRAEIEARCAAAKARMRAAVRSMHARSSALIESYASRSSTSRRRISLPPGWISPNCSAYRRTAASPSVRTASTMGSAINRALLSTGSRRIIGISSGFSRRSICTMFGAQNVSVGDLRQSPLGRKAPRPKSNCGVWILGRARLQTS